MKRVFLAAALTVPLALVAAGCGPGPDRTGEPLTVATPPESAGQPAAVGWMEVVVPGGPPADFVADEAGAWAVYPGGGVLRCSASDGRWTSYDLGGAMVSPVDACALSGDLFVLCTDALVSFSEEGEAISTPLPEGFEPAAVALDGEGAPSVLSASGSIAILGSDGWDVRTPDEPAAGAEGLSRLGPDWVFTAGEDLHRYDPSVGLWQVETMPAPGPVAVAGGAVFLSSGGSVLTRTAPGEWSEVMRGRLCGTLAISGTRVIDPSRPSEVLAEAIPISPELVAACGDGPVWALDSEGVLVCAELGQIETRLSGFDMQKIECTMAGQTGSTAGGSAGVTPMLAGASGAFRIYESVSSRPDPFTEFPARRRDLRRPLSEISIEELRLVGITLDPAGGDQAMVEDINGVPYILYVESQLANNTRVAEITSNEVIVVQEVTVDYGPESGGTASIPTIYTMRLHEEGGL